MLYCLAQKINIPLHTGLWSSMEDLQNYMCELGIRERIYEDTFENPDLVKFSAGMGDLIQQQAPSHLHGTLVSILNPLVASEVMIQQSAQVIVHLRETEHLRTRHNIQTLKGAEVLPVIKPGDLPHRILNRDPHMGIPKTNV